MKKLLLTFIVAMLTCLGAWAQTIELYREDGTPIVTSESSPLLLDVNSSGMKIWLKFSNELQYKQNKFTGDDVVTISETNDNDWNGTCNLGYRITIKPLTTGDGKVTLKVDDYSDNNLATVSLWVKVADAQLATSLLLGEPTPSSTFFQGKSITVPVTFAPETAVFNTEVSPAGQGVTASIDGNTLTISATESATVGDYIVTVKPKAGSEAISRTVGVTVKDKTHATSIDAPATVSIAYGYTKDIPVTFEPAETAEVTVTYPTIDGVTFSPVTLSGSNKTITVNATSATVAGDYEIVLKSGVGTPDEISKTIALSIIAPQHVTGVTLKEGTTVLGEIKTIDKDATFTITAEVAPANAADATLTWSNTNAEVASLDEITGKVVGLKVGETTITATSKAIAGHEAVSKSVKVIVEETLTPTVDGFPAEPIALGANFTPNVTVSNTGITTDDYEVSYTILPSGVLTVDNGQFTAANAGTATVSVNVNKKGDNHYKNAAPIQKVVEVKKNEYTLAISADTKLFQTTVGGSTNISITSVKLNGNDATSVEEKAKYSISYAVSPEYSGVSVNAEGAVTVNSSAAKGQATIVATLTPNDVNNNTTATASVTLTIADVIAGGATIKKDGDFYVINVPYPGALAEGFEKATDSGIEDATTAYAALIAAEKVKFSGDINNDDIKKFSEMVGTNASNQNIKPGTSEVDHESVLTTLDMSGAKLVEAATTGDNTHSFTNDFWKYRMISLTDFTLPTPASSASVLPANFGNWCPNVTTLTIPEGWTGQNTAPGNTTLAGAFNQSATQIQQLNLPASLTAEQYMFNPANLVTIHFAEGTTEVGAYAFENCVALTAVNFPASLEEIGEHAFQGCRSLPSIDMSACTQLTVIPEYAFENCRSLKNVKFPPNLGIIEDCAFRYHEVAVLMFPPLLREIHAGAFQNYGGANSLTDVFFTGVAVTPNYVATTAFSASTQMCNNSVADNAKLPDGSNAISNGTITRNSYHNGGFLGCILHFPAEADRWKYTDPDRIYDDGGRSNYTGGVEDTWNSKSMFDYQPKGWTAEFLENAKAEITNMKDPFTGQVEQQAAILYGTSTTRWDGQLSGGVYINSGYPDRTYGSNKLWPSQQQMQNGYTISRAGYLWKGTQMTTRELDPANNVDLRGLYQFIVAFTDAPDNPEKWKFKTYSMDLWYTLCVPFNMSVDEIKNVFGKNTQVCRFSNVTREVSEDATSRIVLEFRKSVMVPGGYASTDLIKVSTVLGSEGAEDTYANETTTGIVHHVPYMIKPGGDVTIDDPAEPGYIQPEFKEDGSRVLPNFKRVGGAMVFDVVKKGNYTYSFEGNFESMPLPNHIYFLANAGGGVHKFFFSHEASGTLNPYTASVRVRKVNTAEDKGDDDWRDFFSKVGTSTAQSPASQAKFINSFFGDEEDPTAIEEVRIVCGDDKLENDDRIFNLRGQQVNGYNLPAGIYVKNGKKFVVK